MTNISRIFHFLSFAISKFKFYFFISSESYQSTYFLQTLKLLPEISISVPSEGLIEAAVVMAHRPQEVFNPRFRLSAVSDYSTIRISKDLLPRPHLVGGTYPVPRATANLRGSNVIYDEGHRLSMLTMPLCPVRPSS